MIVRINACAQIDRLGRFLTSGILVNDCREAAKNTMVSRDIPGSEVLHSANKLLPSNGFLGVEMRRIFKIEFLDGLMNTGVWRFFYRLRPTMNTLNR